MSPIRHRGARPAAAARPESLSPRNAGRRQIAGPGGNRGARPRRVAAQPGAPLPVSAPGASAARPAAAPADTALCDSVPGGRTDRPARRADPDGRRERHRRGPARGRGWPAAILLPGQPAGLPERVADKAELAARVRGRGHRRTPTPCVPDSAAEAAAAAARLGPAAWWRSGAGPGCCRRPPGCAAPRWCAPPREARRLYERTGQAGSRLLLQAYLPAGRGHGLVLPRLLRPGRGRCLLRRRGPQGAVLAARARA